MSVIYSTKQIKILNNVCLKRLKKNIQINSSNYINNLFFHIVCNWVNSQFVYFSKLGLTQNLFHFCNSYILEIALSLAYLIFHAKGSFCQLIKHITIPGCVNKQKILFIYLVSKMHLFFGFIIHFFIVIFIFNLRNKINLLCKSYI